MLLVGRQKGHLACKNEWWIAEWLSVWARCTFAYIPADTTAIHCLLLQEIQNGFGFTFLVLTQPGSPRQYPEGHKTVVVVVVVVLYEYDYSYSCYYSAKYKYETNIWYIIIIIIIIFVYFGLTHATKQRKKGKGQAQMSVKNTNVILKYCNMTNQ